MEKGVIIIREPNVWSENISDKIGSKYHHSQVASFDAKEIVPANQTFLWERCHVHTKLIVINNVHSTSQLQALAYMQNEGKLVNRKHQPTFTINPRMVLICDNHLSVAALLQSESIKRRFEIIYRSEPANASTTRQKTKPSALRQQALEKGQTPLRVRHKLSSSLNVYYIIVSYNGSGWQNWLNTMFYQTPEQAEAEIEKAVEKQPGRYINDKVFQPE